MSNSTIFGGSFPNVQIILKLKSIFFLNWISPAKKRTLAAACVSACACYETVNEWTTHVNKLIFRPFRCLVKASGPMNEKQALAHAADQQDDTRTRQAENGCDVTYPADPILRWCWNCWCPRPLPTATANPTEQIERHRLGIVTRLT